MIRLVVFSLILVSCSAKFHEKQAKKHIAKAIEKDPTIDQSFYDTLTLVKYEIDTVWNSDSTFVIETRSIHYDTVVKFLRYDFSEMKTWFETWQENKTERTKTRQGEKTDRKEIKESNNTEQDKNKQDGKMKLKVLSRLMIILALGVIVIILLGKHIQNGNSSSKNSGI